MDEKDPKRLFEGNALIRRLVRVGVLDESRMKLDYVLALKVEDFLERRLQTCVYKLGLAKSIHHARVLIRQRHIRYAHSLQNVFKDKSNIFTVLASRSSTSHRSSSVSTPRSTSTLLLPRHSVVDVQVVSGGRRPPPLPRRRVVTMLRRRRSRQLASRSCPGALSKARSLKGTKNELWLVLFDMGPFQIPKHQCIPYHILILYCASNYMTLYGSTSFPSSTLNNVSTTATPLRLWFSLVLAPTWGVSITF